MYTLEGVSSVANFITAYEESQQNRYQLNIYNLLFLSKSNLLDFNLRFHANCLHKTQSLFFCGKKEKYDLFVAAGIV